MNKITVFLSVLALLLSTSPVAFAHDGVEHATPEEAARHESTTTNSSGASAATVTTVQVSPGIEVEIEHGVETTKPHGGDATAEAQTTLEVNTTTSGSGNTSSGTSASGAGGGAGKVVMSTSGSNQNAKLEILNMPEVQAAIYVVIPSSGGNVSAGSNGTKGGNVEFEWKVEEGESAASADYFLKIPPIEGESGEKGGTEDINIGVGELQEGKTKEIVIVGSKVRALSGEQIAELLNTAPKSATEVKTEADLALFAAAAAAEDQPTEEVAFYYGKIIVKHAASGKLFGVIPHSFVQTIALDTDADGTARVKVKLPWYGFLLATDVSSSEIEQEAQAADDGHKNWINVLSAGADASVAAQATAHAQAFVALSQVLKTKHEAAMNSVRNMK